MLIFGSFAFAQALSEAQITKMMKEANEAEISMAKLADRKSKNPQVKAYAKKMMDEHKKNEKEVKKVARKEDIGMDRSEDMKMMKENAKTKMSQLKDTPAAEFDKAYIASQVEMHQQLLDNINNKFLPAATTPELKTYLETTKGHVQTHLDEAKTIQTTL